MEMIGSLLNVVAGIALVVLGVREVDASGVRTRSGKQMLYLGLVVVLAAVMVGWPGLVAGFKAGLGH